MTQQGGTPIPVHLANASLPGIAGGATEAKQDSQATLLTTIAARLTGAPNVATGNVTAGAAATLVAARATRRTVTIVNNDALLSVYIGPPTVSAANGLLIRAAAPPITLATTALIQVFAPSGSPVVSFCEVYD